MTATPKNVMIVEDEVVTQRFLKDVLAELGINVTGCVNSGEKILELLKTVQCDMILVDINIKGSLDGLRLAKRILDSYDVCIIFITAYSDKHTVDEATELSPYGFIVKPFTISEIEIAIKIGYKRFLMYQKHQKKHQTYQKTNDILINDDLCYSIETSTLFDNDEPIYLSKQQIKLIETLCMNLNNIVSNEIICIEVWGEKKIRNTSLRTLVYNIRKSVPSLPLVTYSKTGYMLKSNI